MKVSIITVCRNSAATIVDTLRSVATQTHADIEHILIDGGSRDATLSLVGTHGRHLAHVVSEPDHGIYDAMNKGIALASGELLGFINADDVLASRASVASLAQAVQANAADAAYGDLVYVRNDDTQTIVRRWSSGQFDQSRLRFGWMPPHPTFYVRKAVLNEVGNFDTTLRIAADYDLMLRCLTRPGFRAVHVPEVLVRMRLGGASNASMANLMTKSREDLKVLQRHGTGGLGTLLCKNLRKLPQFL